MYNPLELRLSVTMVRAKPDIFFAEQIRYSCINKSIGELNEQWTLQSAGKDVFDSTY